MQATRAVDDAPFLGKDLCYLGINEFVVQVLKHRPVEEDGETVFRMLRMVDKSWQRTLCLDNTTSCPSYYPSRRDRWE